MHTQIRLIQKSDQGLHHSIEMFWTCQDASKASSASDQELEVPGSIPGPVLLTQEGQLPVTGETMCT